MARRKKLDIPEKRKGDTLYSYEFNEVVEAINDISYEGDVAHESIQESLYNLSYDMYNLSYDMYNVTYNASYNYESVKESIDNLVTYTYTYISPSIDDLLEESARLLGITNNQSQSIEGLLEESARLLGITNDHETRIMSAEELLAASQRLLEDHTSYIVELQNRTASEVPSTNGNVQQDIDDLLAESQRLLGVINDTKSDLEEKIETSYNKLDEKITTSYNKLNTRVDYVEDTTLTFTIEGMKIDTNV